MIFNFVLTTTSLAVVHERVPDRNVYGPLPDVVLDNINAQDWALSVSEILIIIMSNSAIFFVIFHKHRLKLFYLSYEQVKIIKIFRFINGNLIFF